MKEHEVQLLTRDGQTILWWRSWGPGEPLPGSWMVAVREGLDHVRVYDSIKIVGDPAR